MSSEAGTMNEQQTLLQARRLLVEASLLLSPGATIDEAVAHELSVGIEEFLDETAHLLEGGPCPVCGDPLDLHYPRTACTGANPTWKDKMAEGPSAEQRGEQQDRSGKTDDQIRRSAFRLALMGWTEEMIVEDISAAWGVPVERIERLLKGAKEDD